MPTLGAIDVGSNSVKLLIARAGNGRMRIVAQRAVITRLGAGVRPGGQIRLRNADVTLQVLADFKQLCDRASCDRVLAVGTEALRRARNAPDFVERCEYEAGIRLRVIPGVEEARLSFRGATADWPGRILAALDVGGGSSEFMVGRDGRPSLAVSLPVGCVAVTEEQLKQDPPTRAALARAREEVRARMPELPSRVTDRMRRGGELIGVGGTAITAGAILGARRGPRTRIHGMSVTREELEWLLGHLAAMTPEARRQVAGLEPDRADVIVAGLIIVLEAMDLFESPRLVISRHGLRRGMILEAAR